jgi:hypothetical protein
MKLPRAKPKVGGFAQVESEQTQRPFVGLMTGIAMWTAKDINWDRDQASVFSLTSRPAQRFEGLLGQATPHPAAKRCVADLLLAHDSTHLCLGGWLRTKCSRKQSHSRSRRLAEVVFEPTIATLMKVSNAEPFGHEDVLHPFSQRLAASVGWNARH